MLVRALLAAVALSILLSIAPSLKAQGATTSVPSLPGPNGCGTGWNTWLVPDSLPVLACAFESACNAHDVCYGKCEGRSRDPQYPHCEYLRCREGGDLFGSKECKTNFRLVTLDAQAERRRASCDADIYRSIRGLNKGKPVCEAFAVVYQHAVKRWGKGAFVGIDPVGRVLEQPRAEYEQAIQNFFRYGTQEQFQELVKTTDATGKPKVDFASPIQFDKSHGLVNR